MTLFLAFVIFTFFEIVLCNRFVVANSEFKFKEFNADSKQCRKTTLAPTFGINVANPSTVGSFGGAPVNLVQLPLSASAKVGSSNSNNQSKGAMVSTAPRHYVYTTSQRVIGIGCFPLTGNPEEVRTVVCSCHIISFVYIIPCMLLCIGGGFGSASR